MTDMQKNPQAPEAPAIKFGLDAMETDKALDCMVKIAPEVATILNDDEAEGIISQVKGDKVKTLKAGDAFSKLVPLFARKYKEEFLRIVAACQDCSVDEARAQTLTRTTAVFAASLRTMTGFFACCLHMARNM